MSHAFTTIMGATFTAALLGDPRWAVGSFFAACAAAACHYAGGKP